MNVKIRDLDPKFISEIDRRCVELSNRTGVSSHRCRWFNLGYLVT
ncbi:hypothetical protein EfmJHP36_31380 (plasmid) [Enterococcus faecium]|nr:hypothetical protein EfmJHP36_31380 [Enterococcus faecium]